jgi:hypothetical protein
LPKGYRAKPVENVLAEIASLKSRHVMLIDDNFIADPAYARQLLQAFRPLRLTWHTAVSADIGQHDDILDLMTETGCRSLFIGFESLNPASLRATNKLQNRREKYEDLVRKIHGHGMMVNARKYGGFVAFLASPGLMRFFGALGTSLSYPDLRDDTGAGHNSARASRKRVASSCSMV